MLPDLHPLDDWLGVVLATLSILAIVLGFTVRLGRSHIANRVDQTVNGRVDVAVGQAMTVLNAKLDAIQINTKENSAALGRIHDLEIVINNGIHADVKDLKSELAEIKHHLLGWETAP